MAASNELMTTIDMPSVLLEAGRAHQQERINNNNNGRFEDFKNGLQTNRTRLLHFEGSKSLSWRFSMRSKSNMLHSLSMENKTAQNRSFESPLFLNGRLHKQQAEMVAGRSCHALYPLSKYIDRYVFYDQSIRFLKNVHSRK